MAKTTSKTPAKTTGNKTAPVLKAAPLDLILTSDLVNMDVRGLVANYGAQDLAHKLVTISSQASRLEQENSLLKGKIEAILSTLLQAIAELQIPSKITFWWALGNIRTLIDLVKRIIDILREKQQEMLIDSMTSQFHNISNNYIVGND